MADRTIRMTADLIVPDDSDTDVYGEPTLEGYGETLQSGWYNPALIRFEVDEEPDLALEETYGEGHDEEDPAEWLAQRVIDLLGSCEADTNCGVPRWFTANDFEVEQCSGMRVRPAVHPEGFTAEELHHAATILHERGYLSSWRSE